MSYPKLLFIFFVLVIMGCGTESDRSKENLNWILEGLENQEITTAEIADDKLYVVSTSQLFSKEINQENEWDSLKFYINTDTSEFGDILFNGNTLFVVIRNTIDYHELPNNYKSLYKSNDEGITWEPLDIQLEGREQPYVLNRISKGYTGVHIYADWHIIFKSADGGVNWENLSEGQQIGVSEFLYVSQDHPNQIWTGGWNNVFAPYLAKSEDGGQSWQNLSNKISINATSTVLAAVVHPEKVKSSLISVSGNILKSEDGGETWETVLSGYNVRVLKNSEIQPNRVYASGGSPQGQLFVAISGDYGDSWEVETYEESPGGIQTNDMVVTEVNGKEMLYFGTNKGVYSLSFE